MHNDDDPGPDVGRQQQQRHRIGYYQYPHQRRRSPQVERSHAYTRGGALLGALLLLVPFSALRDFFASLRSFVITVPGWVPLAQKSVNAWAWSTILINFPELRIPR